MNLPADTAAILRAALNEAEYLRCADDHQAAYEVLSDAVGNLLPPESTGPARFTVREEDLTQLPF